MYVYIDDDIVEMDRQQKIYKIIYTERYNCVNSK